MDTNDAYKRTHTSQGLKLQQLEKSLQTFLSVNQMNSTTESNELERIDMDNVTLGGDESCLDPHFHHLCHLNLLTGQRKHQGTKGNDHSKHLC